MKQTFYLQKYVNSKTDFFLSKNEVVMGQTAIGTITLDVEPIRKEVEKVFECKQFESAGFSCKYFNFPVPVGAYDVKVVYKVKE
jgi:hypothetical protein